MALQLTIFTLVTGSLYLMLGTSTLLNYSVAKFFNLSIGSIISFAAYFVYHFHSRLGMAQGMSILLALLFSITIAVSFEWLLFGYMRKKNHTPLSLLVASAGLFTILQNIIPLLWGDETISLQAGIIKNGYRLSGAYFTGIQLITVIISLTLYFLITFILSRTIIGKAIRAVSSNSELSKVYGINSSKIVLIATAVSSAIAALSGILVGLDIDIAPYFGFNYYLYGVIVMIVGGMGSYRGLVVAAFCIAALQQLAGYYFDTKWMEATVYLLLILFLLWKPLGVSGELLRKKQV